MRMLYRNIYETLMNIEKIEDRASNISERLGLEYPKQVSTTQIGQLVSNIVGNLKQIAENTTLNDNINSVHKLLQFSETVSPLMEGVSSGIDSMKDSKAIVNMYSNQANEEIKKKLYCTVQNYITQAKLQTYANQRQEIENEKIGFFGKLIGKEKLKQAKIANIDLKVQLEKSKDIEEKDQYSVRDMLSDLYGCVISNYGGDFSKNPNISQIYNNIKEVFGGYNKKDGAHPFLDEDIKRMAEEKIRMQNSENLPVPKETQTIGIFGKTKTEVKSVEAQNYQLQQDIEGRKSNSNRKSWAYRTKTNALSIFENKLKQIYSNTLDKTDRDNSNRYNEGNLIGES